MVEMTQETYNNYKNIYEKILITNKIFKESFDNKKILKNKKDILLFIESFFNKYQGCNLDINIIKSKCYIIIKKIDTNIYQVAPGGSNFFFDSSLVKKTTLDKILKQSNIALDDSLKLYINNYSENFIKETIKDYINLKKHNFI